MKKVFFTCTLIYCSIFVNQLFAQNDSTKIANIYAEILLGIEQKDFSKSFDYTYPRIFELVPRDVMEKATVEMLTQEGIEIGFLESEIKSIKPLKDVKGIKYQKVIYRSKMFMKMDLESDTSSYDPTALVLVSLKKTFGAKNVSQDEESKAFIIDALKTGLAVLDPNYGDWKVITIEANMEPLLEKILPKEVLKQVIE